MAERPYVLDHDRELAEAESELDAEQREEQRAQDNSNEPLTCTIELITGRTVHVNHTPREVENRIAAAARDAMTVRTAGRLPDELHVDRHTAGTPLIRLERVDGMASRRGYGWPISLNPQHIVGIYPLISMSER